MRRLTGTPEPRRDRQDTGGGGSQPRRRWPTASLLEGGVSPVLRRGSCLSEATLGDLIPQVWH